MRKIKIITYSFIFILISCSDNFLDRKPQGLLISGTFPETEDDAIMATNAIYNTLRIWHIHSGGFPIMDIASDEATKGSNPGDGSAISVYDNFTYQSNEGSLDRWWRTLYQGIRRANLVIVNLPSSSSVSEPLKTRLLGEARFLRAYFYSTLVRSFGDVPKVLEIDPPLNLTRAPSSEIYNEIIFPDLEFAATNLPEKSDYGPEDLGRVTRGAAKGLLARMYLFLGDFANVEKYCTEIINSGQYDLESDYSFAFDEYHENGVESLFEIGALPFSFSEGGNQYANTLGVRGTPNRGWGFGRPSYPLITSFDQDDPRLDKTVVFLNEIIEGVIITGDGSTPDTTRIDNQIVEIECYNQKIWTSGSGTDENWGHNKRIIRYADVLLMAAEAHNELNQPDQALIYLNSVRNRARHGNNTLLPDIITTDQALLRQAIYDERSYELALEGLRFWDLIRTNRAESILSPMGFIKGIHELFPIPQSEIDISEGRILQNFGY